MKSTSLKVLMKGLTESEVPDIQVSSCTTDSRTVSPGSVFVAIKGENFDGNDYAESALSNGAAAAVVTRGSGPKMIKVNDTRDAYCGMAGNYRDQFSPLVVGVTGSVGKTTTKEMVAAIFSSFEPETLKNLENRNNEIGLPETVFNMNDSTKLAVFEMGMSGLGEISRLSRCVKPHAGIITYIGVSHIEMLGSRENILKAKLEIIDGMDKDGFLVINGDDPYLTGARDSIPVKTYTFGTENADCDVTAVDIEYHGFSTSFHINDKEYGSFDADIPCSGIHNVKDAISAYTLATRLGFDPAQCAAALSDYAPAGMRQRFKSVRGITVIEDCYNAAPESMESSLRILSELECEGKRIAVLGDMLELGKVSMDSHKKVGSLVGEFGIDILLCYGELSSYIAAEAVKAGVPEVLHFDDKTVLARHLCDIAKEGDIVLFKASRGMALEDVINMFYGDDVK